MKRPYLRLLILALLLASFVFILGPYIGRAQEEEEGEEGAPEETEQAETATPAPAPVETSPAEDPFNEHFIGLARDLADRLEPVYYRRETVEGLTVIAPNPTAEIEKGLLELERRMPREPKLPIFRSRVEVALGKMDEAKAAMETYVKLSGRSPEALAEYADYLHSRLSYVGELHILEERAQTLAKGGDADRQKAKTAYLRIVKLIVERRLTDFNPFDFYRKIIAMLPNDSGSAMDYVRALEDAGKAENALKEADKFAARFTNERQEWFKVRVELLRKLGRDDAAVALYETLDRLDPPELYNDYFAMLTELGGIGAYRRKLEAARAAPEPADSKTMVSWFRLTLYSGENDKAYRGIQAWIEKLKAAGKLKDNLSLVGEMLLQSDRAGSAAPYFYALYVNSRDPRAREDALWGLFRSLSQGEESGGIFSAGVIPGFDLMGLDDLPSVSGGVLSLLVNDRDLKTRIEDLDKTSRTYRTRRMAARVADEIRRDFPRSAHLPDADWAVMETAALYKDWGTVEKLAVAFSTTYPNNYRYFDSLFTLASSFANREKYAEEGRVYRRILDESARRKNSAAYLRAFNEYVLSLTNQKKYLDALSLYWEEIGRHPDDEKLYEEFLKFAGAHNLYDQELKLYQRAIAQFGEASWYNKMARWYLRHKGEDSVRKITEQVRSKLDESALGNYFGEFVAPDWEDLNDVKSRFYLDSYLYAHRRFTHNLEFVRGLLRFYDNFNRRSGEYGKELEALRAEYFIFAGDIRSDLMRNWMSRNRLAGAVNSIGGKNNRNIAETFLLAWGRRWMGDHEGAVEPFGRLTTYYPGSPAIVSEAASLDRGLAHSFYGDDPGRTMSAAERYRHLATLYPQNSEYLTLAGEVLAESGNLREARRIWSGILDIGRGLPSVYKELATLLWDYYQFDEAAATLEQIRSIRNDPYLFSAELAAVYESKGDYDAAGQYFRELFRVQPSPAAAAYVTFADYLARTGKAAEAEKIVQDMLLRQPENHAILVQAARYYIFRKDFGRAQDYLRKDYELFRSPETLTLLDAIARETAK